MYVRYLDGLTATEHNKVFYGRQLRQENYRIINYNSSGNAVCREDFINTSKIYVLIFYTTSSEIFLFIRKVFLSQMFLLIIRIQRDTITHVQRSSFKVPLILVRYK